jgi:hypothetical protein
MTPAQLQTLKTALLATSDPALFELVSTRRDEAVTAYINEPATPAFYVYKALLSRHEILTGTSDDGTTFAWAAGAYITRSQGERDAFREMFNDSGTVNPALPAIQAAFADIFSGAGGAGNRAHITALSRRTASIFERIFTTGTGSKASPGVVVVEGPARESDVSAALNLP